MPAGIWSQISTTSGLAATLEKVPVVKLAVGAPTWKSWGIALGSKGVTTSIRPREDLNLTLAQYNFAPISKQTAFQFKGSDLLKAGEHILFDPAGDTARNTALDVIPRSAEIIGKAKEGNGRVVELTYALGVKSESYKPQPEEHAFFGEPADNGADFAKLQGNLTYTKLFKETKFYPTWGIAFSWFMPVSIRLESRPEISGKRTISAGKIVSRQFLQQNQATLEGIRLKTQFIVDDKADLQAFLKNPTVPAIHEMMKKKEIRVWDEEAQQFDPDLVHSYVPGHGVVGDGGLRLSAVNENSAFKLMTDLTGRTTRRWDPKQTNLDVVFQDQFQLLSGKAAFLNGVLAPDRWAAQASHWVNQKVNDNLPPSLQPMRALGYVNGKLPSWLQFRSLPQYVPTRGALDEAMTGKNNELVATSNRITVAVGSPAPPNRSFKGLTVTGEAKLQRKLERQGVAPAISNSDYPLEWLDKAIDWSKKTKSHVAVSQGGYENLDKYLKTLEPRHSAETRDFRDRLLPLFREPTKDNPNAAYTGFLSLENLAAINLFLENVAARSDRRLLKSG